MESALELGAEPARSKNIELTSLMDEDVTATPGADFKNVRIIAMTADVMDGNDQRCLACDPRGSRHSFTGFGAGELQYYADLSGPHPREGFEPACGWFSALSPLPTRDTFLPFIQS